MQDLALKINEELKTLHPLYIKEVYDFVSFLKEKQKRGAGIFKCPLILCS